MDNKRNLKLSVCLLDHLPSTTPNQVVGRKTGLKKKSLLYFTCRLEVAHSTTNWHFHWKGLRPPSNRLVVVVSSS